MNITIHEVRTKSDLKAFINFPWGLYKNDPNWIPPLKYELNKRLNIWKNSFFKKGKGALFLAKRGSEIVGRISVSIDKSNLAKTDNREGNFGSYEAIEDINVTKALLDHGIQWLQNHNISKVSGPIQFRLEDPYPGFLVEGHEHKPYFMMTYSMPYYAKQFEEYGFSTAMDLYSYEISKHNPVPQKMFERSKDAVGIQNLKLRNINMKKVYEEAEIIRKIFNDALSNNWGHVPFSEKYARKMAKDLKMLADPRIIFIAEVNNKPVGAVINLPNYNDLLHDLNGNLFPRGLFRIMLNKKKMKSLRGYALAVDKEYRNTGLGCLLISKSYEAGIKAGYERAEITWILGNNKSMNNLVEFMGASRHKVYRLYQCTVDSD